MCVDHKSKKESTSPPEELIDLEISILIKNTNSVNKLDFMKKSFMELQIKLDDALMKENNVRVKKLDEIYEMIDIRKKEILQKERKGKLIC